MCQIIVAATGGCCVAAETLSQVLRAGCCVLPDGRRPVCTHTHTHTYIHAADHTASLICWIRGGLCLSKAPACDSTCRWCHPDLWDLLTGMCLVGQVETVPLMIAATEAAPLFLWLARCCAMLGTQPTGSPLVLKDCDSGRCCLAEGWPACMVVREGTTTRKCRFPGLLGCCVHLACCLTPGSSVMEGVHFSSPGGVFWCVLSFRTGQDRPGEVGSVGGACCASATASRRECRCCLAFSRACWRAADSMQ
jgi:hypothetical protein